MEIAYINSPIGGIEIIGDEDGIISISLNRPEALSIDIPIILQDSVNQLNLYFKGKLQDFNLRYNLRGTVFQKKVWDALQAIPYGKTVSYQDIAHLIGNDKALQAVGTAISKNPCAISIPCHRVINKNGNIGGFAGGIDNKRYLLKHENIDIFK
jgi:methylated-DNA-[protein]-cysteine S-methyltransferase